MTGLDFWSTGVLREHGRVGWEERIRKYIREQDRLAMLKNHHTP